MNYKGRLTYAMVGCVFSKEDLNGYPPPEGYEWNEREQVHHKPYSPRGVLKGAAICEDTGSYTSNYVDFSSGLVLGIAF